MDINLRIDTEDHQLARELMGNPERLGRGCVVPVPGNSQLTLAEQYFRRGAGFPETLYLVLSLSSGLATGLAANWLYDRLRGRKATLWIEELEVDIDASEIKRVIHRVITRSD